MKFLTDAQVAAKTAMSASVVWKLAKEGTFPKPVKLPNVHKTVWVESEVEEWMQHAVDACRA